ncbi:Tn3 family transposase, partial [Cysteiniphilum sp. SYW-8]
LIWLVTMLTGDNHTVNQINYVALDAIDIEFVPSIKNIREASNFLYCARDPDIYKGLISPKGKVDLALIKSQKREIIRVLLSLILQHNTQAVIVKKLSSHKRNIRLKSALWEYNKIFKTIHILNLINDESLRQKLRRARNRTESYHQLQRIIRKVHDGLFRGNKTIDNCVYIQASRLIANCVIAYNAILLSNVYLKLVEKYEEDKAKQIINRISPVAWQHINFTGRYKFMSKDYAPDIEAIVKLLESKLASYFEKG